MLPFALGDLGPRGHVSVGLRITAAWGTLKQLKV